MRALDIILAETFNDGDLDGLYKPMSTEYSKVGNKAYNKLIELLYDVRDLTGKDTIYEIINELDRISDEA